MHNKETLHDHLRHLLTCDIYSKYQSALSYNDRCFSELLTQYKENIIRQDFLSIFASAKYRSISNILDFKKKDTDFVVSIFLTHPPIRETIDCKNDLTHCVGRIANQFRVEELVAHASYRLETVIGKTIAYPSIAWE